MESFARVTLVGSGTEYAINMHEIAMITKADSGTQIVFTGPNKWFGNLHNNPGGDAGIIVSDTIEDILALAGKGSFIRVTPIETSSNNIFEGPETYIRLSSVTSIHKDERSPKTWIVFDSVIYVREGGHLPEGIRPGVLGVRESLDEILSQ
jgi:hypothetical protein